MGIRKNSLLVKLLHYNNKNAILRISWAHFNPSSHPVSCCKCSHAVVLELTVHYWKKPNVKYEIKKLPNICRSSSLQFHYSQEICLNHPKTIPALRAGLWKNCLPQKQSLVPKRLETLWWYLQVLSHLPWGQGDIKGVPFRHTSSLHGLKTKSHR